MHIFLKFVYAHTQIHTYMYMKINKFFLKTYFKKPTEGAQYYLAEPRKDCMKLVVIR